MQNGPGTRRRTSAKGLVSTEKFGVPPPLLIPPSYTIARELTAAFATFQKAFLLSRTSFMRTLAVSLAAASTLHVRSHLALSLYALYESACCLVIRVVPDELTLKRLRKNCFVEMIDQSASAGSLIR
jgi:hypothetical protein